MPADFLGTLDVHARARLMATGRERRYARGVVMVHEHDEPGTVLVVLEGEVVASTLGRGGKEVVLSRATAGQLVGELSALRGSPRSATLKARTDVVALAVPSTEFRRFLETVPGAALAVLDTVIERLHAADDQRRDLASRDVLGRLARRLLELAEQSGAGEDFEVTHEQLAAWAGASRESVTKALGVLRSLGAVETRRGSITVLDEDVLRRQAGM